ncbi:MAG: anhydro-N-acetylmuramic acid kinase [Neisseriaceae bacterium]|nr:MAG: anhydro-N-acetylmuramic acid kinase [Neisseriaceae bacterium]
MHNHQYTTNDNEELYLGLMSGTSLDGIDAVCASYQNGKFKSVLGHHCLTYSLPLKKQLFKLQNIQNNELHNSCILGIEITKLYVKVVKQLLDKLKLKPQKITAIGCHGQTIRHYPEFSYSIQLANYALLAEETKINVVGDFRTSDLVAGGQGAPLVPLFHQELFSDKEHTRIILNIGGISNITILKPHSPATGFDTGPGNMLLDEWCRVHFKKEFDTDGKYSKKGTVILDLLLRFLETDFFKKKPPKSTGRDLFSKQWLDSFLSFSENSFDVARTLVELTAVTIVNEIKKYTDNAKEIFVCGGGIYNNTLMNRLKDLADPAYVLSIEQLGIHPMHVEATAFSWLAMKRIHKEYGNLPSSTGAKGNRILGALWQPFK